MNRGTWFLFGMLAMLLAGCGEGDAPSEKGAAATTQQVVTVYNWSNYLPDEVLESFTKETGIQVIYRTYTSNEDMYDTIKRETMGSFDVVVPSTYYVSRMAREGMLEPIDRSALSNFDQLDPATLGHSYDPANAFSVPYLWGGTGLMYDKRLGIAPTSWRELLDMKHAGKTLLLDDVREVLGVGLLLNGHSINSVDPVEIAEAHELLEEMAPAVGRYDSDSPMLPFVAETVQIGMIWNGDAYLAMGENENLAFVWPDEGAILWMDNFVIMKESKNKKNALRFIDFMLRPEIAAQCSARYGYATANMGALRLMIKEYTESPVIYPPAEVVARSEFQDDVGKAAKVYAKYWKMLRGSWTQ